MKKCTGCKQEKEINEYGRDKSRGDGLNSTCKICDKQYSRQCETKCKDGLYHVYILPDHNYVGYTDNIKRRMYHHKNWCDRNISNYEVAGSFKNKADAVWFEALLHSIGYEGKHSRGSWK